MVNLSRVGVRFQSHFRSRYDRRALSLREPMQVNQARKQRTARCLTLDRSLVMTLISGDVTLIANVDVESVMDETSIEPGKVEFARLVACP